MSAIAIEHVSKRFAGTRHPAVDDCSLSIDSGELTVLLGPSGCGKTTLLKLINRLYEPDSGRILIGGEDVRSQRPTELRRRIGYVIQQVGLFPHLTVERNIAVVPELLGWSPHRIEARIEELLDLVGLPRSYRRRHPRQLSGGEQQRVGLARALAADPAIMLMDEPFGALDAITRARLQDELRTIQQKLHKTIVFVTHDVDEALRLADRIAVMRNGRILQHDRPLEMLTRPRDAFVGELLASDDVLRHLSLVPVRSVLKEAVAAGEMVHSGVPTVHADDDLRSALSMLLRMDVAALAVIADGGAVLGRLTLDDIRSVLRR